MTFNKQMKKERFNELHGAYLNLCKRDGADMLYLHRIRTYVDIFDEDVGLEFFSEIHPVPPQWKGAINKRHNYVYAYRVGYLYYPWDEYGFVHDYGFLVGMKTRLWKGGEEQLERAVMTEWTVSNNQAFFLYQLGQRNNG